MINRGLHRFACMHVLLDGAKVLARNLAYHRRASLEAGLQRALDEVD
jgi:hypothetical protein